MSRRLGMHVPLETRNTPPTIDDRIAIRLGTMWIRKEAVAALSRGSTAPGLGPYDRNAMAPRAAAIRSYDHRRSPLSEVGGRRDTPVAVAVSQSDMPPWRGEREALLASDSKLDIAGLAIMEA